MGTPLFSSNLGLDKEHNCIYTIYTAMNKHTRSGGGNLNIIIENTSPEPLYEQIARQVREAVLSGELTPGGALPSIRHLARELKVSIITTKRAYEELEADGFLQTTPGKGSFVSQAVTQRLREAAVSRMEQKLTEAVDTARAIGITLEEFEEIAAALWNP